MSRKTTMRVYAFLGAVLLTLCLPTVAVAQNYYSDDCDIATIGNQIASGIGNDVEARIRVSIRPSLDKYNLGCLTNLIRLGGMNAVSRYLSGALRHWLDNRRDSLCQVILNELSHVPAGAPDVPGVWRAEGDRT
jgi:hypothetical protein